jgi:hypothetical protein
MRLSLFVCDMHSQRSAPTEMRVVTTNGAPVSNFDVEGFEFRAENHRREVRKWYFVHFYHEKDRFTKTGSGQTW